MRPASRLRHPLGMAATHASGPGVPQRGGRRYGSAVRFRLLGPLAVSGDDGPIAIGGPKQRLVLAHLLLHANTTAPIDGLIDAIWGEGRDRAGHDPNLCLPAARHARI